MVYLSYNWTLCVSTPFVITHSGTEHNARNIIGQIWA